MSQQPSSQSWRETRRETRRRRRETRGAWLGVVLVIAGVAFLLQSLGVWTIRGDVVWPLILIALGAAILIGRFASGPGAPPPGGE